jgi:hypothetical protein
VKSPTYLVVSPIFLRADRVMPLRQIALALVTLGFANGQVCMRYANQTRKEHPMENRPSGRPADQATTDDEGSPFGPVIYGYSRVQAIADGLLIDVSAMAKEAGFSLPVAMTSAAWSDCVEWSDRDSERQTHQDESGRLWDVLWLAHLAARRAQGGTVAFTLHRVPRGGKGRMPRKVALYMDIGPGDVAEPVITLMMPGED